MPKNNVSLNKFNRGLVSPLALGRTELENMPFYAEEMINWMPRTLGSMMLRPGLAYIGATRSNNQATHIPFVFSNTDKAIIEITSGYMRVRVSESIITRGSVSTAFTNGTFNTDVTGWTDADESGATSVWATGGYLSLSGTDFNSAIRRQTLTISGADQNDEHAIRVIVARGNMTIKLGSTSGGSEYFEYVLGEGEHSLVFTPTSGNVYVEVSNRRKPAVLLDSIAIESSGSMEIEAPWTTAEFDDIRYTQSGDVIYVADGTNRQYKIERRSTNSWSLVVYAPEDGPFRNINTGTIQLTPSAVDGDITLTASKSLFKSTQVGALFKIDSNGQFVTQSVTGADQWTDPIKVIGVGTTRNISVVRTGTWVASVNLQRSIGEPGSWTSINTPYTTNGTTTYNDALDNQIIYYRIGVDTGDYTSGTAVLSLESSSGSISGVAKITGFTSSTSVSAAVLTSLGETSPSANWYEGQWSDLRGYPSSVELSEGRLWWAGKDKINGSVSDSFESFDDETVGDSGPISRSIGRGPVDKINWIVGLARLMVGGQGAEWAAKSSNFDEPLTPTNFNIKDVSTQGSANVAAVKVDGKLNFVQKSKLRIFEMIYDPDSYDYVSDDLCKLVPDIGDPGITKLAVQRQPDTRIHCLRSDGTVAILVRDPGENVRCFVDFETDGTVEDIFVLPGDEEDEVYYCVNRTINGSTVRYLEKWAMESECQGDTLNKQADSFILYSGASTVTMTGLSHLEGETVYVWGNGAYLGSYTVASASITLTSAVTSAVIGLTYRARFKSSKLAVAAAGGTALAQRKRVAQLGLLMRNVHQSGIKYGGDFDNLDDLPAEFKGEIVSADTVHAEYDIDMFEFNDTWNTDSRICLEANAPKPCTVLAAIVGIQTNDKA